ncbi:hypothetical protein PLEOSDRAFT_1014347, partial [Pleurotus ostreatus PC15]
DPVNFSCAYDALFTILYAAWRNDNLIFHGCNSSYMVALGRQMVKINDAEGFVKARDVVRVLLHRNHPSIFPYGPSYIAVSDLWDILMPSKEVCMRNIYVCPNCQGHLVPHAEEWLATSHVVEQHSGSIGQWLSNKLLRRSHICENCETQMVMHRESKGLGPASMVGFVLYNGGIFAEHTWSIEAGGTLMELVLKGVVFWHESHFTSVIVNSAHQAWFHDGIKTKEQC